MSRWMAVSLMLLVTGIYAVLHQPHDLALARGVLAACPTTIGEWSGAEHSFEDAVIEDLDADDILIRRYARGPEIVWLCVVYHQNKRYGAHDPRLCYEAQGYRLEAPRRTVFHDSTGTAREAIRFVAERAQRRRIVYYWWVTKGYSSADVGEFRGRMAMWGALENRSWGAFVRVEALVRDGDEAAAERAARDFAARVGGTLPGVLSDLQPAPRAGT